jgi:hypothetical protein
MYTDADWTPPLLLTLEDSIWDDRTDAPGWVRIVGLALDGDHVQVTLDGSPGRVLRLPAVVPIHVLRATPVGEEGAVDDQMASWYAGDVDSVGAAMTAHAQPAPPVPGPGRAVPAFARDPELVGIYGGDLDHVMDAVGAASPDARARTLRDEVTRRSLAEAAAHPPARPETADPDAEEAQDERMAGYYGGDLGSVLEHRKKS